MERIFEAPPTEQFTGRADLIQPVMSDLETSND